MDVLCCSAISQVHCFDSNVEPIPHIVRVLGNKKRLNSQEENQLTVSTVRQYGYAFQAFSWIVNAPLGATFRNMLGTLLKMIGDNLQD